MAGFEVLYKKLASIEEQTAVRKTTLSQLLCPGESNSGSEGAMLENQSALALEDRQEPEVIAEVEKGS